MKNKHILCPIDFSKHSQVANIYASMFADAWDAELIYLHVVRPAGLDSSIEGESKAIQQDFEANTKPIIQGVACRYLVRYGEPASEILQLVDECGADLIVIGTHGRSGIKKLLHGSICENVLRHAQCPVMAVKPSIVKKPDRNPDSQSINQ